MKPIEEPVEKPGLNPLNGTAFTHPAFGQIGASRVSGRSILYGTDFEHQNFVTIRIRRSELHRGLSHDFHFGRNELIEVSLSEAQWATFVSSMNVGDGVPCTIEHVAGEDMPALPRREQKDVYRAEVRKQLAEAATRVESTIRALEAGELVSLSKAKRDAVLADLRQLKRDLGDRLPFIAKSLEQHMENTVEHAKVEVGAYVQQHVLRAGLEALGIPLQLDPGRQDPDGVLP